MSKVFIFLAITIMMLSIGSFMVNTPEFNTVQTNQNELIDITQQITTDNETDLVIFNGSMLTPEISIPYIGGMVKAIWYPIKMTLSIITLVLSYMGALLGLTTYIPIELTPLILIGILYIAFILIKYVSSLGRD